MGKQGNTGSMFAATEQVNVDLIRSLHDQQARLLISYQGTVMEFAPGPHRFIVGRGADCDLVVQDK